MAKKPDVFNVSNLDTAIGSSVKLRGNIASEADVAIDGTLLGNLKSGGHVAVGVNGRIKGHIQAVSVVIAGRVDGDVAAEDSITLMETSQLKGDIATGRLEIAMGAIFIGKSIMKAAEATEVLDDPGSEEPAVKEL